jgi:hypothetical protein
MKALLLVDGAGIGAPADEGLDVVRLERFPGIFGEAEVAYDRLGNTLTPWILEWKDVPEYRADAGFNRGPQQPPGAVQPGLDRLGPDVEESRGFVNAHFLDHAGDKVHQEFLRQPVDRLLEEMLDLTLRCRALRVRARGARRQCYDFVRHPDFVHRAPVDCGSTPTKASERFVHDDATEPGSELRIPPEIVEVGKSFQVCVLDRILGFGIITENAPGYPVEAPVVTMDDRPNSRFVARADATYQIAFQDCGA